MNNLNNGYEGVPESMPQSRTDLMAQVNALQTTLNALQIRQQDVWQELQALKAAQLTQMEKIEQIRLEVLRGRWWRRFGAGVRFLMIVAVIGAVLYFALDWQALLQWFV